MLVGIKTLFLFVGLVLLSGCQDNKAPSQKDVAGNPAASNLCGGGIILADINNLPQPNFRTRIGNAHISVTTQNELAQQWFDQGLNHLHGFWHLEAWRAFQMVIKEDPQCAMGYWGLAMCQPGFGGDDNTIWKAAITQANDLCSHVSPLEKAFIKAAESLVDRGITPSTVSLFRDLYHLFPDEPDAIALAAIILRQETDEAVQTEVKTLLENAMQRFPDNVALQHYYIHVMELRPEFSKAIKTAERMVELAPNSNHLIHMPGHLYFLKGDYDKAISVFEKACAADRDYHRAESIPLVLDQNYMHNLHYLCYAYCENNQKDKALAVAEAFANITLKRATPIDAPLLMLLYEGRILPALVYIRFGEYQAAAHKIEFWLNSIDFPIQNYYVKTYLQVMLMYCQAMDAVMKNDFDTAMHKGGQLSNLIQEYESKGTQNSNSSEFKSINETFDIMSMMRYELAGWLDNMDKTRPFNGAAWKEGIDLQNSIHYDEPPRLMYPIEESLTRLHKMRGEKKACLASKQQALLKRPNSKIIQVL